MPCLHYCQLRPNDVVLHASQVVSALVTGASQGIGLATAVALAEAGASVAFNYRSDPHEATAAVAQIERAGGRAILLAGDVADQAAVERMVAETVAAFGRLDIAVSNAAYSDREPFYEADMAGFRRTIDVTMWGAFYLVRAAARQMIAQAQTAEVRRRGSIVVVSSPHAYVAIPRSMAYNMSKAAIDQMARTAAIELVEHKIRVNIVTPGWIDTPGERKFASDETIRKRRTQAALEAAGHARGDRPRRRVPVRSGQRLYYRKLAVDRRRHHASLVGQSRLGRAGVTRRAIPAPRFAAPAVARGPNWRCAVFCLQFGLLIARRSSHADYLLPCSCGERCEFRRARPARRCAAPAARNWKCPPCADLRQLAPVDAPTAGEPAWGDRQRVAFVLSVIALAALCVRRLPGAAICRPMPVANERGRRGRKPARRAPLSWRTRTCKRASRRRRKCCPRRFARSFTVAR